MAAVPLQKRTDDLFASYGHADKSLVDPIVDWLRKSAGLKVWYDAVSGDASKRSTELLANGIQSSRGAVFFLWPSWQSSAWCKDEHELALTERRENESYLLVALRILDFDIPAWFKTANILDFRKFDERSAAELLRSLSPDPSGRMDNEQDVYFAGPWTRPSNAATQTLRLLSKMGWRLVGDSPDHRHFKNATDRIRSIIETCRGLVAVLPFDRSRPPTYTSPWVTEEVDIAIACNRPFLLLAEEGVQPPPGLVVASFGGVVISLPSGGPNDLFQQVLEAFDDELARCPHSDTHAYSFLVTSLLAEPEEIDDLVSVVEQASKIPCIRGQYLSGEHVQRAIIDRIQRAAFCIADVSSDNKNSLIEAGVALGSGTPLHLLSRLPADGSLKRRFMFEDREMNWYPGPLERVGLAYRIARMYRRRVLSPR
jgi:TIR domain-containing protein